MRPLGMVVLLLATLVQLSRRCNIPPARVAEAVKELGLDPEKAMNQ